MSIHTKLLAGSGLVAVTLLSGTAAQAAMHHKHAHHAAMKSGPSSEVTELKAEVEALSARLEAAEAAQRITADQAATASANAQSAAAQSAQTSAMVAKGGAAISGQIKSAINAYASSGSDTKVSGVLFLDASNINSQSINGAGVHSKLLPSGTGFDIKRAYLSVDHTFNKTFSADLTVDFNASGSYSANASLKGANIYIKKAYLQAKLSDALIVRFGAADLPWIPFVDGISGMRYIENSVVDRVKYGNTADYGIHALGTLGNPKGFNVTYAAAVVNGGGFKNPTRSNSVDLEGRVAANYKGFTAAVGGYTGKLATDSQTSSIRTASRVDGLVAYKGAIAKHAFTIGGEYFWAKDNSQGLGISATTPNNEFFADGYSGFASVNVTPKIAIFGRYDWTRPIVSTTGSPYTHESFYDMGLSYAATKGVDISLVYKHDKLSAVSPFASSSFTTQDATLALGTNVAGINGTANYDEFGIFTQVKF